MSAALASKVRAPTRKPFWDGIEIVKSTGHFSYFGCILSRSRIIN